VHDLSSSALILLQKLERKADKHLARQDGVLIHAIVRVWRAHERGKLLERVRDSRSLQKFWSLWKQRMAEYRRQGELALAFAGRPRAALAASALQTWKHVHQARQRALQLASQYYAVQMQQRAVLAWRIRLRRHTKLAKQARIADKYFVVRGAWVRWRQLIDEKGRQRKLRQFEQARTKKAFDSTLLLSNTGSSLTLASEWLERTQKERQLSLAEDTVKIAVATVWWCGVLCLPPR
jgi:protein SFI1